MIVVTSQNPKMRKPIHKIDADKPDHAEVSGGGVRSQTETVLRVHKQGGRWSIVEGSF